jgi:hypothetical protein
VGFATGAEVAERAMADPDLPERPLTPVEVDQKIYPED